MNDAVYQNSFQAFGQRHRQTSDVTCSGKTAEMCVPSGDVKMAKKFIQIFSQSKKLMSNFLTINRLINHYFCSLSSAFIKSPVVDKERMKPGA